MSLVFDKWAAFTPNGVEQLLCGFINNLVCNRAFDLLRQIAQIQVIVIIINNSIVLIIELLGCAARHSYGRPDRSHIGNQSFG